MADDTLPPPDWSRIGFNSPKPAINNPDNLPVIPALPPRPQGPSDGAIAICGACGIRIYRVMHYSCPRTDCPCFPKVTL